MNDPDVARVKEVFEQWAMYDAVVRADYMRHAELAAGLAEWAAAYGRPLSIVDLGCSDAWLATHAFRNANVEHYLGVDLAESSIERARENLAIWPGRSNSFAAIWQTCSPSGRTPRPMSCSPAIRCTIFRPPTK